MHKNILKPIIFTGLFLIPFIPFLVSGSLFFPFITTKAFAFRIIMEVVFFAWLLLALGDAEYRPKRTPILYAMGAFLLVAGIADAFGAAPLKSFWSNYERMEGFVLLIHLGAFFVVTSSVFKDLEWKKWWNTSLVASFIMVLYCFLQILGLKTINQGGVRVDGTFGNAIYLAVYMLFHIFIAFFYMAREWKNKGLRFLYGALIILEALVLYYTATRGTVLGLLGGLLIFALLNMRNREVVWARKASISLIALLVVVTGGFFAIKNTAFVQTSPVLSRFATINLSELKGQGRYYIWPMAWQGIKEHPVLGWGQDNFGYVFQKHYNPKMYNLEPWFDRAHNVFLDWAIAGGLVGLVAYLLLYVAALMALWKKGSFTYTEKTIFTSLIAAYFFHNLFVFDHLFSYILFFSLLAHLESRSTGRPLWLGEWKESTRTNVVAPALAVLLILSLYFVTYKPLVANISLIRALISLQSGQFGTASASFEKAYNAAPLGRQETAEQIATHATEILSSTTLPIEDRNAFYRFAGLAVLGEAARFPDDVRYQLLAGLFLNSTGKTTESLGYFEHAKELAPAKQEVYFQAVNAYLVAGDTTTALADLKTAYELAPEYPRAKTLYLVGAIYANNRTVENEILKKFGDQELAFDDTVFSAYYEKKRFAEIISILEARKKFDPVNAAQYDAYIQQVGK